MRQASGPKGRRFLLVLPFVMLAPLGCFGDEDSFSGGNCGSGPETEVFVLVNEERGDRGVEALACDPTLAALARAHSQDMCDRDFFSHTNPDGEEPHHRLNDAGVSWTASGENITATQSTAQGAMDTWMGSSGHRANILSESFGRIGVGYVPCDGEHLWTQVFTN